MLRVTITFETIILCPFWRLLYGDVTIKATLLEPFQFIKNAGLGFDLTV